MPLDVSYLRSYLGGVDSSESSVLESLLSAAQAEVEGATGRRFGASTAVTEYYHGDGGMALELRSAVASGTPTVSVNLVSGGDPYGLGAAISWLDIASTSFYVDRNFKLGVSNMIVLTATRFPFGRANVKVTYNAGYGTSGLNPPAEIWNLIADLVGIRWRGRVTSAPPQGEPTTAIPAHLQAIIDRWKYVETPDQVRLARS